MDVQKKMREAPLSHIVSGIYSQSVAILVAGVAVVAAYLAGGEQPFRTLDALICQAQEWLSMARMAAYGVHFVEIAFSALALSYMAYSRNVIRTRSKLPGIFFVLFCCSYPACFLEPLSGTFMAVILAVVFLILFSPSTEFRLPLHLYVVSFLFSAAGVLYPSLFLYIPVIWLGSAKMASFGFKCLLASFLGIVTPFWLLGAAQVIWDFSFCFQHFVGHFYPLQLIDYQQLSFPLVYTAVIALIGFFCWARNTVLQYEDKIITRIYNGMINLLFFYTLVLICLNYSGFPVYLPILTVCVSLQAAHCFTHVQSRQGVFLFYLIITVFILFFLWNLFQNLVTGVI